MDVVDKATRSRMMSGIRGKNTQPELIVRSFLHRKGLRFRLHAKLPGKPDLAFPKYKTAVFVHGCFWHRHKDCQFTTTPKTRPEFWQVKFASNVKRDVVVKERLEAMGWRVLVVWACQTDNKELDKLASTIRNGSKGASR
jgi:DNA mismatch endonuclease (patch repair protein)